MQKRYLLVILAVLILGVIATRYYGDSRPRVILTDAASVQRVEEIGSELYRTVTTKLENHNLIAFGVSPTDTNHQTLVESFIREASAQQKPFDLVFQEPGLPALSVPDGTVVVPIYFNSEVPELVEKIKSEVALHKRALIYTVNLYSSHTLATNPIRRFEAVYGGGIPAITTIAIGISREQEFKVDPPCIGSERDGQGTANLGCTALHKQRSLYRRGLDSEKIIWMLEEQMTDDYLAFVYLPTKKL